jgi:hypothetical protein
MILSTMQRLTAENLQMHRERATYWVLLSLVIGYQTYKLFKGVL